MKKHLLSTALLLILSSFTIFESQAQQKPKWGRPIFEKKNGTEWLFYGTANDYDYYVESNGRYSGDLFYLGVRSVKPGQDRADEWRFNCRNKTLAPFYDEPFVEFSGNQLIEKMYDQFCASYINSP